MFKYVLVVALHHGKFLINLKVSVKMNFMLTNIFGKKVNFLQNQRIGKDLKKIIHILHSIFVLLIILTETL